MYAHHTPVICCNQNRKHGSECYRVQDWYCVCIVRIESTVKKVSPHIDRGALGIIWHVGPDRTGPDRIATEFR